MRHPLRRARAGLLALAVAVALALCAPAHALVASINGVVLNAGAPRDTRAIQNLSWPAGETGQINLAVTVPAGTAYDLTGAQILFTVKNRAGAIVLSRQATINSPASAGTAYFPLVVGDTYGIAPLNTNGTVMSYDVWVTDVSGNRYQIVPLSQFTLAPALGAPNQPVTVPPQQQPLSPGPPGTPPLYSIQTVDGTTTVVMASYTLVAGGRPLSVDLTALGQIVPQQSDGGLGEKSYRAYFTVDNSGNVTKVTEDTQGTGSVLSTSFGALSPQPVMSSRIVGSRVDVLITGTPSTVINWIALDTRTTPAPPGANAGNVGPAGPAGIQGPAGTAPTYTLTTTDGTTQKQFASYTMAASSLLVVRLSIAAAIVPNPGDGGMGEYSVESWFVTDASSNVTKIAEDIQFSSGTASASFGALSPAPSIVTTTGAGGAVAVKITGTAATTIKWVATDTRTTPAPPGAVGPQGPQGVVGPIGPAGVPLDAKITTTDATLTTLTSYPVAASSYRMLELRIVANVASAGLAIIYLNAYATADGSDNITIAEQDTSIVNKSATIPAGLNAVATASGGNLNVNVTGAVGATINWEVVDWSTAPPLAIPAIQPPAFTSYNADLVTRSSAMKWRQHERAKATFDGSTSTVNVTWPDFQTRTFEVHAGAPTVTDGLGGVSIEILSVTSTGCTVQASDLFTGEVDIDIAEVL